ncbi:MAG: hypothetical protein R3B06_29825 [Kofleriaceae bacterium]
MVATAAVIDALLAVELPAGPVWKRYNGDGYGEHRDGAPFDGTGVGRPWPLLTAERAHFELAAGRGDRAAALADTLAQLAGDACLLPEQVWDDDDLPHRELRRGGPTGSAMPLVWAHAEFLKLCRSLADGQVFDLPPQPVARYQIDRVEAAHVAWRKNNKCATVPAGKALRIELTAPATIHWSVDGWRATIDSPTRDTGLGLHVVELAPGPAAARLDFTIYWTDAARWEGRDFAVELAPSPAAPAQGAS